VDDTSGHDEGAESVTSELEANDSNKQGQPPASLAVAAGVAQDTIRWIDPRTKKTFTLDARTGNNVLPSNRTLQRDDVLSHSGDHNRQHFGLVDRSALTQTQSNRAANAPLWLDVTLQVGAIL
jgi:hypothetical protein